MTAPKSVPIPTAYNLAQQQLVTATTERAEHYEAFPMPHWPDVASLTGPLLPGQLWVIGARTGQGKTTFLLNMVNGLLTKASGFARVVYFCTETSAAELRCVWAAQRLGYAVDAVLENRWADCTHTLSGPEALTALTQELVYLSSPEVSQAIVFVDVPRLNLENLAPAIKEYVMEEGYGIVVIDHIHRYAVKDANTVTAELSEAVRKIKGSATSHRFTALLAAQINRPSERTPTAEFLAPPLAALKQSGALEEEANIVLLLHRARKADVTHEQIRAVVEGRKDAKDLIEPGIMCVSVGKHRTRNHNVGRTARLRVDRAGRIDGMTLMREPGEEV